MEIQGSCSEIKGSFAGIEGSFVQTFLVEMYVEIYVHTESFVETEGSFAETEGSCIEIESSFAETYVKLW